MKKGISYFFGGVNGVGKSTMLNAILSFGTQFEMFKGSSRLMQRLGISVGDYDSLRALPDEVKELAVNNMMEEVLLERTENSVPLLVDAHFINYKKGEMRDATGPWMRHLKGIFLVEAPAEIILERARSDSATGKRQRDLLPDNLSDDDELEWINRYILATREKANEISRIYGVPNFVLINEKPDLTSLLERFTNLHESLCMGEDFLPKVK